MLAADGTAWWDSLAFIIPFALGIASGGQGIYAKLGGDWLHVLRTFSGWVYWFSRGLIPLVCYALFLVYKLGSHYDVFTALLCGLGSETVLRSRLFIGSTTANGKPENIYRGVFDLIEWYQNLLLRAASDSLAAGRKALIKPVVESAGSDFPALCEKVMTNAASFEMSREAICGTIRKTLAALEEELASKGASAAADLHRRYTYELGYALLRCVSRKALRTLLTP